MTLNVSIALKALHYLLTTFILVVLTLVLQILTLFLASLSMALEIFHSMEAIVFY